MRQFIIDTSDAEMAEGRSDARRRSSATNWPTMPSTFTEPKVIAAARPAEPPAERPAERRTEAGEGEPARRRSRRERTEAKPIAQRLAVERRCWRWPIGGANARSIAGVGWPNALATGRAPGTGFRGNPPPRRSRPTAQACRASRLSRPKPATAQSPGRRNPPRRLRRRPSRPRPCRRIASSAARSPS